MDTLNRRVRKYRGNHVAHKGNEYTPKEGGSDGQPSRYFPSLSAGSKMLYIYENALSDTRISDYETAIRSRRAEGKIAKK